MCVWEGGLHPTKEDGQGAPVESYAAIIVQVRSHGSVDIGMAVLIYRYKACIIGGRDAEGEEREGNIR
jgi:hypothetical protein